MKGIGGREESGPSATLWSAESEGHVRELRGALAERAEGGVVEKSLAPLASDFLTGLDELRGTTTSRGIIERCDPRDLAPLSPQIRQLASRSDAGWTPEQRLKLEAMAEVVERYASLHSELVARAGKITA